MDWLLALGGLGVGAVVGLTGMGGGALMTPMLVIFFGVDPVTAVSSDLVVSLVMKPFGAGVHAKEGTVNYGLVKWLCLGSVPSAFAGVLLLNAIGGDDVSAIVKRYLGYALVMAATSMVVRHEINRRRGMHLAVDGAQHALRVRPIPTLFIGIVGGLIVGMTSVGSGSLIIVLLLLLYPSLAAGQLVGTDLVQAVPLVGAAALGHMLFGHVEFGIATSLMVGAIPGVLIGARISSRAPDHIIRPILVFVLLASGAKLLEAPNELILGFLGLGAAVGAALLVRSLVLGRDVAAAEAALPPG
ncbi:MAG: sulfite exporter TauE/SafE family protein [Acidimicrobiia bacterium]|nr:sulfite exporter TauE/SafE family protein [Acidimicrobiia bacterium]